MLEYLKKKYEELFSSVFDPIFKAILESKWWVKILALGLTGIVYWSIENPEPLKKYSQDLQTYARVMTHPTDSIALSNKAIKRILESQRRLILAIRNDANIISTGEITGWSAAQALLAISKSSNLNDEKQKFLTFINGSRLEKCSCWPELNTDTEESAWIFISGWVLSAKASTATQAEINEINFLLNNQNANGSWQSSPRSNDSRYESTYSTAWAVLGLFEQSNFFKEKNKALAASMSSAADRGASWLLKNRQEKCRWKPYPNLKSSSPSESISGLVVHTLHTVFSDEMKDLEAEWLDNVPDYVIPASVEENSYVELFQGGKTQIDHFVQLTMPWMTIGTIDAYKSGSLRQKVKAIGWIENIIMHESIKNADANQTNWWRAELSLAINYAAAAIQP